MSQENFGGDLVFDVYFKNMFFTGVFYLTEKKISAVQNTDTTLDQLKKSLLSGFPVKKIESSKQLIPSINVLGFPGNVFMRG